MSRMLYRGNGKTKLHGVMVDYIVAEEEDVESYIEDGWHMTPIEADEFINEEMDLTDDDIKTKAPTRKEMEDKANELGIKFPSNIKDSTLLSKINEKIEENKG